MTLTTRVAIESWFALGQTDGSDTELIRALEDQLHDHVDCTDAHQWKFPPVTAISPS